MENLPLVVLRKLFGLMPSLKEQVKCSHVCRNWRAAFEAMKPDTLALYSRNFAHLNHRLFYTNEQMPRFSFLRMPPSYDYLHSFFDSNASALFVNIKKLVVFECVYSYKYTKVPEFRLRKQFNHFQKLEHLEFICNMPALEGAEIDLPNLKVLSFWGVHQFDGDDVPVILNTPRLQALQIYDMLGPHGRQITTADFKFLFPQSLRFIEMTNYGKDFKFETEFANLECLIFHWEFRWGEGAKPVRMFGDDFLKLLPSLKVLYFDGLCDSLDLPSLEEQIRRFGMMNLKIVRNDRLSWSKFDYSNWNRYVQDKHLLLAGSCRRYPQNEFQLVFDKLINCRMPLDLFKEGYFRIRELKVRQVPDQTLLVDLLRKAEVLILTLEYDCNLGQSFFDQIADSLTVNQLTFGGYDWSRLSDPSVLRRLNMLRFEVHFQKFARAVASAVLNNPACFWSSFQKFKGFYDEQIDGETRKDLNDLPQFHHYTRRVGRDIYCETCGWISARHPGGLQDPIKVTLNHIKGKIIRDNVTSEKIAEIEAKILDGTYRSFVD